MCTPAKNSKHGFKNPVRRELNHIGYWSLIFVIAAPPNMVSNVEEDDSTVIAIDADRHSQHAVKWAVEHLLNKNTSCTLIHVITKTLNPRMLPPLRYYIIYYIIENVN